MNIKIYDKVSWHFPDGKDCPSLEAGKRHFDVLLPWLEKKGFLTEEGKELLELGIGSSFSLHSGMLTNKGNQLLSQYYSTWLKDLDYTKDITTRFWDKLL